MQRQKTIAKWLAIILLLTAIIACYIAFSAIVNNKKIINPDVAGGANTENDDNTTVNPPSDADDTPAPVYSTFPRLNENVDGLTVRHTGGDGNDVLLGSVYYAGRRFVLFYSASMQYDVKESGIHIAVYGKDSLLSVNKIADADESFIAASLVQNGLLVITKNSAQTKLRLFDSATNLTAENSCAAYTSYKLHVTSASARLYAADERFVYALTITQTLDVIRSNFVYPIEGADLVYTASADTSDILIVQAPQGIGILSFGASVGFTYRCDMNNCRLLQILPFSSNSKPAFALLAKSNDSIVIASIDDSLKKTASYLFKDAKAAVALLGENGNIHVYADNAKATFCSHLELQSSSVIQFDETLRTALLLGADETNADVSKGELNYKAIDGEQNKFIMSRGNTQYIVSTDGNAVTPLIKVICKSLTVVHEPLNDGISKLSVLFDGTAINGFAYMCFGASDVFYVTLP